MDTFDTVVMAAKIGAVVVMMLQVVPIMVWVERRGSAMLQKRLGPNRIGPFGLLQSLADAVKMMTKEDRAPGHVNSFYYKLAPLIALVPAFMTFAVIPFGPEIMIGDRVVRLQVADLNVGVLYIFAIASLGVYGIIMGSWASNNKYAMFGGLRSTAQMISYELSMGLSIIGLIMTFSSVSLFDIVLGQSQTWFNVGPVGVAKWGVLIQPLGFLVFLVSTYAETNRLPFDLPEGESEIVAGYHLEYHSMMFGVFMMAEYINMTVAAALTATLFFGGFHFPFAGAILAQTGLQGLSLAVASAGLGIAAFTLKTAFFMWLFVWVRWSIPRFRYDQLMDLGWKVMLPLSLLNVFITGILIYFKVL